MPASDVPGYLLGYRFNAANYAAPEFADLSGNANPMIDLTGTPTFETVDGHEGILLDNTWHSRFWHPNSWQGTVVAVLRLDRVGGGTIVKYLMNFAADGASGGNGKMTMVFSGNDRRIQMASTSGRLAGHVVLADSTIGAAALCQDQIRETPYATLDGTTIVTGVNGSGNAMGSNDAGTLFGALSADSTNTTAVTNVIIHAFELHFFEGNPILDAATELTTFLAELASDYS